MIAREEQQVTNAIKWIEALLSGEYKQSKFYLGSIENGFCCWGLGCYIVGRSYSATSHWERAFHHDVGYKHSDGKLVYEKNMFSYHNLAELNDNENWTFEQIGKELIKYAHLNFNNLVAEEISKHFSEQH